MPASFCSPASVPGAEITNSSPSMLMEIASPKAVFNVLPSVAAPLSVCLWVKMCLVLPSSTVLPSSLTLLLVNISTMPADPGDTLLMAMMSALSLTTTRCPNLLPEPCSVLNIAESCLHTCMVLSPTSFCSVCRYTTPVSELNPGAEAKRNLGLVDTVLLLPGSAMATDHP